MKVKLFCDFNGHISGDVIDLPNHMQRDIERFNYGKVLDEAELIKPQPEQKEFKNKAIKPKYKRNV